MINWLSGKSEDEFQYLLYKLTKICEAYNVKIYPQAINKTKIMVFKGKEPVKSKIFILTSNFREIESL